MIKHIFFCFIRIAYWLRFIYEIIISHEMAYVIQPSWLARTNNQIASGIKPFRMAFFCELQSSLVAIWTRCEYSSEFQMCSAVLASCWVGRFESVTSEYIVKFHFWWRCSETWWHFYCSVAIVIWYSFFLGFFRLLQSLL